jgi:two-component system CheB/CheR fusion protein
VAKRPSQSPARPKAAPAAPPLEPVGESDNHRLIVGVGASAGGLEAFKHFLEYLPARTGMTFVFIQHLDPARKSLLVELLGGFTKIPVVLAEDGAVLEADRVYVIPPDATLTVTRGALHLVVPAPAREHRRPIDAFLATLAEDQGELAVAIILSGGGSDGSEGVRAIKENGGLTLAQASSDDHAMSGMPSSAAATGQVDFVLPVEAMPAKLAEYRRHLIAVDAEKGPDGTRQDAPRYLARICQLLRAGIGHDFSHYKEKTMVRRVQRRMQILQINSVPDYVEHLRKQPGELRLLFQELLIGVTQFFRDASAFEALEQEVIPKIVERHGADDAIRVWVPGCATGEEAYSIGILLKEATLKRQASPLIQVFGTDINEQAIEAARTARYRAAQIAGVDPVRLKRWFAIDGDEYCPIREIRELCIFATHSVIKDPPFSRLDLISCRNLLIYLDPELQDRLTRVFHYALRPGGALFVGTSEGMARHIRLFTVADKRHRIFERSESTSELPDLPVPARNDAPAANPSGPRPVAAREDVIERAARRVMEKHAPAYVVIDRNHEILRFSGQTGRYLGPSPGTASLNLFGLLQRSLRPGVRGAVQEALATRRQSIHEAITLETDGDRHLVDLIVEPFPEPHDTGVCIVAFRDRHGAPARGAADKVRSGGPANPQTAELEAELAGTRVRLQATIDELETANEEMKSANEEYQSVNEELQSANEELETSKEELQSVNEELQTVNTELNNKNEVLGRANSDLRNLLDSTEIATIFLDSDLCVTNFTPALTDLFPLREVDRGRPITEIVGRLHYGELKTDVERVLRTLASVEREVSVAGNSSTFITRVRPYRTVDNVIDGVVITFVDITDRKHREREMARLAAIVESSIDAIIGHAPDGTITSWNAGAEMMLGYTVEEAIGKPITMLFAADRHAEVAALIDALKRGERLRHLDGEWVRKNRSRVRVSANVFPVIVDGAIKAISLLGRDVGERQSS